MSIYGIREITTLEEFMGIHSDWDRLLAGSEVNNFFLTFEWVSSWWQCFGEGNRLYILAAEKNGIIAGIAPLMIAKNGKLQFIGTPLADYGDFIVNENKGEVLAAFLGHLSANKEKWAAIQLDEIQGRSSTVPILRMLLPKYADKFLISENIGCLALDFQKSTDEEIAGLLKKKGLRRHIKFLQGMGSLTFKKISNVDEAIAVLDTFFEQHIEIWGRKNEPSMFLDAKHRMLFKQLTKDLLPAGKVAIWALYLDGKLLALQFGFEYNGSYITYCQSQDISYAKHSPGTILYKMFIEEYIKNGLQIVDFSRGTEPYKYRFSNDASKNMNVYVHKGTFTYLANKVYVGLKRRYSDAKTYCQRSSLHSKKLTESDLYG